MDLTHKYAWSPQIKGDFESWTLRPWQSSGLEIYDKLTDIPIDRVLIASHFAPWWEPLRSWIADGRPWIEIEYGYWGMDVPRRNTRRVTYCGHHNLRVRPAPHSRSHMFNEPHQLPWRASDGDYVLVPEPVSEILMQRTGETLGAWRQRLEAEIRPHWAGDIVWRPKAGNKATRFQSFQQQLMRAHAVVGERTMSATEACLLGVPGYTIDTTMSTLLMGGLENINSHHQPDRQQWWEHICWSQFAIDEFLRGTVAELVEIYQIRESI